MRQYIELIRTRNFIGTKKRDGEYIIRLHSFCIQFGHEIIKKWMKEDSKELYLNDMCAEKVENNIVIRRELSFDDDENDDNYDRPGYVIEKKYFIEFLDRWAELVKTKYGVLKVTYDNGIVSMELTEGDAEYNYPDGWKNKL